MAGQHPTTVLTWLLAVLIVAPILTHRRFPLASVAVCLAAIAVYATGRYVAYPGLAIFVLTFDIALHSKERMALATLVASAVVIWVSVSLQPGAVAVLGTYIESELGILVAWLSGRNLRHRRARWRNWRPGPNDSSANARKRRAGPWPRSGCASRANCTTSSRTR